MQALLESSAAIAGVHLGSCREMGFQPSFPGKHNVTKLPYEISRLAQDELKGSQNPLQDSYKADLGQS